MSEQLGHNCGLGIAVDPSETRDVVPHVLDMLKFQQPRGHDAFGMSGISIKNKKLWVRHWNGEVADSYDEAMREVEPSYAVLGHLAYGTSGKDHTPRPHPRSAFIPSHPQEAVVLAFNGQINKIREKIELLQINGINVREEWDTEVYVKLLGLRISQMSGDVLAAIAHVLMELDGAMTTGLFVTKGTGEDRTTKTLAFCEPTAIRPGSVAVKDGLTFFASENSALLDLLGQSTKTRDLQGGEAVELDGKNGPVYHQLLPSRHAHCAFEWIYFSNYLSTIHGASVRAARFRWGEMLAKRDVEFWIQKYDKSTDRDLFIGGVPLSATEAAHGYATHLQSIIDTLNFRPHYIDLLLAHGGRTFNESPERREDKVDSKYIIHPTMARGKRYVKVEDSVVRGTTMRKLVGRTRKEAGPSEIHLRIAAPAIIGPCSYGVDLKSMEDLVARNHFKGQLDSTEVLPSPTLNAIARALKVNSLRFITINDIATALGISLDQLCTGCMGGPYATQSGTDLYREQLKMIQR